MKKVSVGNVLRTKCVFCRASLPIPPDPGKGDWGDWKCGKCDTTYCQDCGSLLDFNDECVQQLHDTALNN